MNRGRLRNWAASRGLPTDWPRFTFDPPVLGATEAMVDDVRRTRSRPGPPVWRLPDSIDNVRWIVWSACVTLNVTRSRAAAAVRAKKLTPEAQKAVRQALRRSLESLRQAWIAAHGAQGVHAHDYLARAWQELASVQAEAMAVYGARTREAHRKAASAPRRFSDEDRTMIRRRYALLIETGERYGAIKRLARDFSTTDKTIAGIIKDR